MPKLYLLRCCALHCPAEGPAMRTTTWVLMVMPGQCMTLEDLGQHGLAAWLLLKVWPGLQTRVIVKLST